MKVIIAGSRWFNNYNLLKEKCNAILGDRRGEFEVVSGTCYGTDKLGERYATEYNLPIKQFPVDWHNLGKKGGYLRNKQMAEYADHLIAFHDGMSRGTKLMIELAKEHNLAIRVVKI